MIWKRTPEKVLMDWKKVLLKISCLFLYIVTFNSFAQPDIEFQRLKESYPETIQDISDDHIEWKNGNTLQVRNNMEFINKLKNIFSPETTTAEPSITAKDLRCDTYETFFKKMYGTNPEEVKNNLRIVYWMPKVFGNRYPLKITTVNGVDKKIQHISDELEKLPHSFYKYLENPGGSFYWRNVKGQGYLSSHSFGIAIDINTHYGNYWLWDWEKENRPPGLLTYRNRIPMEIVKIFEQEGFLWGGRWYFYDTMHFEYRPELFVREAGLEPHYSNQLGTRCSV